MPTDTLDKIVQEASVPNLASLFRKAKEAGVITPVAVYGEGFVRQQQQPQP